MTEVAAILSDEVTGGGFARIFRIQKGEKSNLDTLVCLSCGRTVGSVKPRVIPDCCPGCGKSHLDELEVSDA